MRTVLLLPLLLTGCLVPDWMVDRLLDADADGERNEVVGGTDCDDHDPKVRAHGIELCGNLVDDDCDGRTDDRGQGEVGFYADDDGDGFGDPDVVISACVLGEDMVGEAGDCDDADKDVHPGAFEDCANGRDDDCDEDVDESDGAVLWWPDGDGDGWGDGDGEPVNSCTVVPGRSDLSGDCDDADADAHPTARDRPYDGRDAACDGDLTEFDVDGDGAPVDPEVADPPVIDPDYVPWDRVDCDDRDPTRRPDAPEVWYDGVDQDCDGWNDDDQDGDGHVALARGGDDCDDEDPRLHPGRPDRCDDGVDENCDTTDEWDCDDDGHVDSRRQGDDCDDSNPDVWTLCATCDDRDDDGRWSGCDAYVRRAGPDCDDLDPQVWSSCATCRDADGDGRLAGCDAYLYVQADCDDGDARTWLRCDSCADHDGDGLWAGCDLPDEDCDDRLENAWADCDACVDEDGDGVGVGACEPGEPTDCDDTDPDVDVSCGRCVDADGDGSRTGCDQHLRSPYDCDDADPEVGGHVFEVIGDGLDQDCNGADLTVHERDGVFVTPTGVDIRTCGTRAKPCATIGYAAGLARDAGKVVFVAAGTYPAFETWVSVYGGYEAGTWKAGGVTAVELAGTRRVESRGSAVSISGIQVSGAGGVSRTAVYSEASFQRVSGVSVDLQGTDTSIFIDAYSRVLDVDDCFMSGGGSRAQSVGVRLVGDGKSVLLIRSTEIDLASAPWPGTSVGVDATDASEVWIDSSRVTVGSAVDAIGVRTVRAGTVYLEFSGIAAGDPQYLGNAISVWSESRVFEAYSTRFSSAGGAADGVRLIGSDTDARARFVSSGVSVDSTLSVGGITAPGLSNVDVLNSTVVLAGGGVALGGEGSWQLVNSIIVSDGVAVQSPAGLDFENCIIDVGCNDLLFGDICAETTPVLVSECMVPECRFLGTNYWFDGVLDPLSESGLFPSTSFPVDKGVPLGGLDSWPFDVFGNVRAPGTPDIGAVEMQP